MAERTLILFATAEDGFHEWTKIGSSTNDYEELKKEGAEELEAGLKKPSEATGLKTSTKNAKVEMELPLISLSAGEKIKSGTMHCYGKTAVAKAFEYGVIGGIEEDVSLFLSTVPAWEKQTLTAGLLKGLQEAAELSEHSPIVLGCLKADLCECFSLYLELKIEYTATSKAEARLEATSGAAAFAKGSGAAHANSTATAGATATVAGRGAAKGALAATAGASAFARGAGGASGTSSATVGAAAAAKGSGSAKATSGAASTWTAVAIGRGAARALGASTSQWAARAAGRGAAQAAWKAVSEWFAAVSRQEPRVTTIYATVATPQALSATVTEIWPVYATVATPAHLSVDVIVVEP
jgi:hypothetical protein